MHLLLLLNLHYRQADVWQTYLAYIFEGHAVKQRTLHTHLRYIEWSVIPSSYYSSSMVILGLHLKNALSNLVYLVYLACILWGLWGNVVMTLDHFSFIAIALYLKWSNSSEVAPPLILMNFLLTIGLCVLWCIENCLTQKFIWCMLHNYVLLPQSMMDHKTK